MKKLNKTWSLMAILPLCCVSSLFADYNMKNMNTRETQVCETRKTCIRPVIAPAYTAEARPHLCQDSSVFVTGEFLWWTARTDGLHYAMTGVGAGAPQGTVYKEKGNWDPGFRVGLGYVFAHDGWDLDLKYTWFQQGRRGSSNNDSSETAAGLFNTRGTPDGLDIITSASVDNSKKHGLHFNTLDLEMGRWSWVGRRLAFRPFAGVRGAWIKRTFNINSVAGAAAETNANYQKNTAVGPRAGMNSGWYFNDNWSIFGDAAFNILWTNCKVASAQTFTAAPATTPLNTHYNFHTLKNAFDIGLGLRWDSYFKDDSYHLGVEIGWENHNWSNFNQMLYFVDSTQTGTFVQNQGDLGLYGFNIGLCFDF